MVWGIMERRGRSYIKSVAHSLCRVLLVPGCVSPGLMVITPFRPNCLVRQKNIPGQMISFGVDML